MSVFTSIELCAGAGGQALGLEQAGFKHLALVEIDKKAVETLRLNRPGWNVIEADLEVWSESKYRGVDLLAAGLPCPPFSHGGKQLGERDERNLFPFALRIIGELRPRVVLIENVRGILDPAFTDFRANFEKSIRSLGYRGTKWRVLHASHFGVPQLRPRVIFVAFLRGLARDFAWPKKHSERAPTVGMALRDLMSANGWRGADAWTQHANAIAPTLVGGSTKHGGPDLGPTRAKLAWKELGVNGHLLADAAPAEDFHGLPHLTVRMCARLQGFPDDWQFAGGKTAAYRQVGNAFPPPVARAVAEQISLALRKTEQRQHPLLTAA